MDNNAKVINLPGTNAPFQFKLEFISQFGWLDRYVLLQPDEQMPMVSNDGTHDTWSLVFEDMATIEKFKDGLARNIAEIIQASSGMSFDQALQFARSENIDKLIPAIAGNGVFGEDEPVYLVKF